MHTEKSTHTRKSTRLAPADRVMLAVRQLKTEIEKTHPHLRFKLSIQIPMDGQEMRVEVGKVLPIVCVRA